MGAAPRVLIQVKQKPASSAEQELVAAVFHHTLASAT